MPWGEQVRVENEAHCGLRERRHTRREKQLMKWQRATISRCPNAAATNELLWREGTEEGLGWSEAGSLVLIHYIQGKWRLFLVLYLQTGSTNHTEKRRGALRATPI